MHSLKNKLSICSSMFALWAISSNINISYLPWGSEGVWPRLIVSAIICLISVWIISMAFTRVLGSGEKIPLLAAIISILILSLVEIIYWVMAGGEHTMLERHQVGMWIAIPLMVFALLLTNFKFRPSQGIAPPSSRRHLALYVIVASAVYELFLLFIRNIFGFNGTEKSSKIYYAMDCSMFAVFVITIAGFVSFWFAAARHTTKG